MILQNISRRIVDNVLINISSSNIFSTMLLHEKYHQFVRLSLAAMSNNGLTHFIVLAAAKRSLTNFV